MRISRKSTRGGSPRPATRWESGASLTDHAVREPDVVTIRGWTADLHPSRRSTNIDVDRAAAAWAEIDRLMNARELVTLATLFGTYTNMLILKASASATGRTGRGLPFMLELEQVQVTTLTEIEADLVVDPVPGGPAEDRAGFGTEIVGPSYVSSPDMLDAYAQFTDVHLGIRRAPAFDPISGTLQSPTFAPLPPTPSRPTGIEDLTNVISPAGRFQDPIEQGGETVGAFASLASFGWDNLDWSDLEGSWETIVNSPQAAAFLEELGQSRDLLGYTFEDFQRNPLGFASRLIANVIMHGG